MHPHAANPERRCRAPATRLEVTLGSGGALGAVGYPGTTVSVRGRFESTSIPASVMSSVSM